MRQKIRVRNASQQSIQWMTVLFSRQKKQESLSAGSTTGFDVQGCAQAFACAAAAGTVQKGFEGFKGVIYSGGTQYACNELGSKADSFFKSVEAKKNALELHKAQTCLNRKYNLTVKKCAQKLLLAYQKTLKPLGKAGLAIFNKSKFAVVSTSLKQCVNKIAPNNTLNRSFQEALYASCGYPDITKLLKKEDTPKAKLSGTESLLCSLAGLLFVEAMSSKMFTAETDKSIKEADEIQDKINTDSGYEPPDPNTIEPTDHTGSGGDDDGDDDDDDDDGGETPDDDPVEPDIPIEEVAAPAEEGSFDAVGEAVGEALLDVLLL